MSRDVEDLAQLLKQSEASQTTFEHNMTYHRSTAKDLITAGYRQIFDGDCGLSNVSDPTDREAAEAWMRWANLAMNEEIGAIGAMKQMLTELGYRKVDQS